MTASAVPATLTALVSIGQAAGLVTVLGPGDTSTGAKQMIWVGFDDPTNDDLGTAAEGNWNWPWLGNYTTSNEEFTVHCAAVGWNGGRDLSTAVASAYTALATFTTALKADPSLGVASIVNNRGSNTVTLRVNQYSDGVIAYVLFSLDFQARNQF